MPYLGRYEVVSPLACGGMAELFLGRANGIEGFEKQVVLKTILPAFMDDPYLVGMFLAEARLAATLDHPNIPHVYDVGEDEGRPFFAMELLRGEDVRQIGRAAERLGTRPTIEQTLTIIAGVLQALDHAHGLGIVHRDVSPHNVFVTCDGFVKLLDFGVAKMPAALRRAETKGHSVRGKLAYMSPEQVRARPVSPRSDLFSLSIILWELTTGLRLFLRDSEVETFVAIAESEVPRPSSLVAGYPAALEQIVMKGLEIDPARRWASAEHMQFALEELARQYRLVISPMRLRRLMSNLFDDADPYLEIQVDHGDEDELTIAHATLRRRFARAVTVPAHLAAAR